MSSLGSINFKKEWKKGVSFQRNCGAVLVGEYNKVILSIIN